MRVLVAAGGTGGHIYPALAIASYLRKHHLANRILWIGGGRKLEVELLRSQGFDFKQIKASPFPRAFSQKWIGFPFKLLLSFFQSFLILLQFRPTVVIGMGSFHSYPVVMLAFFFGIRSLVCEQNASFSLTNKFLLPYVSKIATSFPQTNKDLSKRIRNKTQLVGNPIHFKILATTRQEGIKRFNLDKDKFTLLFLGGSQGAHSLNKLGVEVIQLLNRQKKMRDEIQVIFITGDDDLKWVENFLTPLKIKSLVFSYLQEIQYAYAVSHLAICRSGATTIAELTALGLPAILIPYPYATGRHQYENARVLQAKGAALLLVEDNLTGDRLKKSILGLIEDKKLLKKMSRQSKKLGNPQATRKMVELICDLANQAKAKALGERNYVKRS
jgi:UDP-N-acetylglucosamine--N-acetylmuramyl-(pentapeptide) pyrophosphoryl-undecaprenol N-acetylglucosamine transferase